MEYAAAQQLPGPASKVWPETNAQAGVICHSMEGYVGTAIAMLDNEAIQVSWHFSIAKDGTVYQHYPLSASPWHAGSHQQNARLIGIEHEGISGEPLTAQQVNASVALVRWIASESGWAPSREPGSRTLWEHHEVPGANTTCPNGRIPWGYYVGVAAPQKEEHVDARPLDFDETRRMAEASFAQFSDVAIDQKGGGAFEVGGDLPVVNGNRIAVPDGGAAYLVVLPHRA